MSSTFERNMLQRYHRAMEELVDASYSLHDLSFGRQLRSTLTDLQEAYEVERRIEVEAKLRGEGPMGRLLSYIGPARVKPINMLAKRRHDEEPAYREDVVYLLEELVHVKHTGYEVGGMAFFPAHNAPSLPQPKAMKSGVFLNPRHNETTLCIPVHGPNFGYVVVVFPVSTHQETRFYAVCYVEAEQEWLTHDRFDIFTPKSLRRAFMSFLKTQGDQIPFPVTERRVFELTRGLDPENVFHHRQFGVRFQNYRLALIYHNGKWDMDLARTEAEDLEANPMGKPQGWMQISDTKKNQLYYELSKVREELVKQLA